MAIMVVRDVQDCKIFQHKVIIIERRMSAIQALLLCCYCLLGQVQQ